MSIEQVNRPYIQGPIFNFISNDVDPGNPDAKNKKYVYDPLWTTVTPDYSNCINKSECEKFWKKRKSMLKFNRPKAVRLAFHDCVGYKDDPKGGCDGCLNLDNNR